MRWPGSNKGPLEIRGHELKGAPVSMIMSHTQLNRHGNSRKLELNRALPREYNEERKRKKIKRVI